MKKNLAKVVTLGLLTASVFVVNGFGQAWAKETIDNKDMKLEDRYVGIVDTYYTDRKVDVEVTTDKTEGSKLTDVTIEHTGESTHGPENTKSCKESSQSITIGQIATMNEAYMANDRALQNQIDDIKKNGTGKDTHVKEGEYTANANGTVTMPIEGSDGKSVVINDVASAEKLGAVEGTAKEAQTTANQAKDAIGNYTDRGEHDVFGDKPININEALDKLAGQAEAEAKVREDADKALAGAIENESKVLNQKINTETERATREEQRIEQKFDGEVSRLDSRIDKLDGRVEKVGAMAAAMASLHTMGYDPAAPTEIAVGVGQYRDKTGLALGAFHYPNKNFMMNVSVSTAGDEFMAGIGATWKIGRRSPEAMLKAEQEKAARQALAKAEAEKKAAKDARVAAQAARHAKMLAERGL